MKKLVILLVVLLIVAAILAGLAYGDLRLRSLAEEHAEQKLSEALPQARGVRVELDGFPFTLGVFLHGEVEALHVRIDAVEEAGLEAHDLSLDVDAIALDEAALLDEQRLVVTDIGRATVQGFVTDEAVSQVVRQKVRFTPGKAHATIKGRSIEVKASVKGRVVQLSAPIPGVPPVAFPLPPKDVLPCEPELELLEGKVRLRCSVDQLPETLKEAMAKG